MTDGHPKPKPTDLQETPAEKPDSGVVPTVIPPEAQKFIRQVMLSMEHHQGPIPSAKELANYKQVRAELPDRIVSMAEKEQANRHRNDLLSMVLQFAGVASALTVAIYGLHVAATVALNGQPVAGGIIALVDLGGLVAVFIHGTQIRSRHRQQADDEESAGE